jgi:hypothetical protein
MRNKSTGWKNDRNYLLDSSWLCCEENSLLGLAGERKLAACTQAPTTREQIIIPYKSPLICMRSWKPENSHSFSSQRSCIWAFVFCRPRSWSIRRVAGEWQDLARLMSLTRIVYLNMRMVPRYSYLYFQKIRWVVSIMWQKKTSVNNVSFVLRLHRQRADGYLRVGCLPSSLTVSIYAIHLDIENSNSSWSPTSI